MYWSNIRVSVATLTKLPCKKYTPSSIENAVPVIAHPDCNVEANGVPTEIVEFPSNPEVIAVLQVNSSPSLNSVVVLLTVLELI